MTHDTDRGEEWEDRLEQRLRALGTRTPHCSEPGCDERNAFALEGVHPNIWCDEHRKLRAGKSWLEEHHLAGRHNNIETASTPANDHRVLSARQQLWPRDTLRNPDGSPLLRAAAVIRGWLDVLWLIMTRTVGWIPAFLEALDLWLRGQVGPEWWRQFKPCG